MSYCFEKSEKELGKEYFIIGWLFLLIGLFFFSIHFPDHDRNDVKLYLGFGLFFFICFVFIITGAIDYLKDQGRYVIKIDEQNFFYSSPTNNIYSYPITTIKKFISVESSDRLTFYVLVFKDRTYTTFDLNCGFNFSSAKKALESYGVKVESDYAINDKSFYDRFLRKQGLTKRV